MKVTKAGDIKLKEERKERKRQRVECKSHHF
jgi:hypothetical protein